MSIGLEYRATERWLALLLSAAAASPVYDAAAKRCCRG